MTAAGRTPPLGWTLKAIVGLVQAGRVDVEMPPVPGRRALRQHNRLVLDQGHLGSCTGNAGTGARGTQLFDKVRFLAFFRSARCCKACRGTTPSSNGMRRAASTRTRIGHGGHEVEAGGVELDASDAFNSMITYVNSWGTAWGDAGRFRMRLRTYEQLSGVDLKQYIV